VTVGRTVGGEPQQVRAVGADREDVEIDGIATAVFVNVITGRLRQGNRVEVTDKVEKGKRYQIVDDVDCKCRRLKPL
jgi:hypothetical protein